MCPAKGLKPIKLYFLTGFLGSGKTTLLNQLLEEVKDAKTGVIVNEFGEINVDAEIIDNRAGKKITEINNGSIFCSCLAGSFIQSIVDFQDLPLDYLFVESSGMAKPSSLDLILKHVQKKAGDRFVFQGMTCVVAADKFLDLVQVVTTLEAQIKYSNLVVINKIDKVNDTELQKIREKINDIKPDIKIIETDYGQVADIILELDTVNKQEKPEITAVSCDTNKNDPITFTLNPDGKISLQELKLFLESVQDKFLRIKGLVETGEGVVNIDYAGDLVLKILEKAKKDYGIVFFAREDYSSQVQKVWEKITGSSYKNEP
ncbi:MAG: CobW family GTP-binding protein [Halanaerobiales bacterium]